MNKSLDELKSHVLNETIENKIGTLKTKNASQLNFSPRK